MLADRALSSPVRGLAFDLSLTSACLPRTTVPLRPVDFVMGRTGSANGPAVTALTPARGPLAVLVAGTAHAFCPPPPAAAQHQEEGSR